MIHHQALQDRWEAIRPHEEELKFTFAKVDEYFRLKALCKEGNDLRIAPCNFIIVKYFSNELTGISTLKINSLVNFKIVSS